MASQTSPVRRVLADKNKNASLQVNNHAKPELATQPLPTKPLTSTKNSPSLSNDIVTDSSPRLGQKRKIDEVEDVEGRDSQGSNDTQSFSDLSDPLSMSNTEDGDTKMESYNTTTSTAESALPSFHASQEVPGPVEPQFIIHEEMSQKTLDRLHAVSLPPNNSLPFLRPNLLKDNSQISVSMSSLIDFDQADSQTKEETGKPSQEEEDTSKSEQEIRKDLLSSKAATLRTRLQLAFYKLQTNQTSTPFSRLSQPSPKLSSPQPRPYTSSPTSSPHLPTRSRYINSPESRIAIARARATMQKKPTVKPLTAITMPDIRPTAYSARWQDRTQSQQTQIPSSPPNSQGTDSRTRGVIQGVLTPSPTSKQSKTQTLPPCTPMQLSSPPGSPTQGIRDTAARKVQRRENGSKYPGGLTSSVVKGEAASSLLQVKGVGSTNDIEEVRETGGCGF